MAHKTKGLRIATRCTSMDQFIAAFHRFVDAQTVFISTLNPRSIGLETAFSIDLADNTPALRGVGVVLESWTSPQNPYGRPGIQLGIRRLTVDSEPILDRLLFAREATAPTPTPTASMMPAVVIAKRPLAKTLTPATQPMPVVAEGERTPGSELILPANPLMNIDDKSLEGFVDCTIYEETGNFFGEQPVVEDPEDPAVNPPLLAPRRNTSPIPIAKPELAKPTPVINKLTGPMGASAHVTPAQFTLPMAFGKNIGPANRVIPYETSNTANSIAAQMNVPLVAPPPAAPPSGPPPIPGKPWISAETAEMLDLEPDPVSVVQPAPTAPVEYAEQTYPSYDHQAHASTYNAPPPQQHISNRYLAPRPPITASRRKLVIGISAGATAVIAIALIASSHSNKTATAATTPAPTLVASAGARVPSTLPDQKKPIERPMPDSPTQAADEPPADEPTTGNVIGKGPCKLAISTTPAGSMISVDGQAVGASPLTFAGKCEKTHITAAHPRYAPADRFVTPKADDTVDISLIRPTHDLFVETQPGGAIVMIDGHRAGTTPTMVKVTGFTTLTLSIEKPGYKPTTKKLYSKSAIDRMSVKLAR